MVLEFELVFFSSMGYVYLQLQDQIFQKFHMQSLYLIHPVKVPIEGDIAAILMDLSKAFDCLPYDLILLKLEAYGL
jgi:hypothetical protein